MELCFWFVLKTPGCFHYCWGGLGDRIFCLSFSIQSTSKEAGVYKELGGDTARKVDPIDQRDISDYTASCSVYKEQRRRKGAHVLERQALSSQVTIKIDGALLSRRWLNKSPTNSFTGCFYCKPWFFSLSLFCSPIPGKQGCVGHVDDCGKAMNRSRPSTGNFLFASREVNCLHHQCLPRHTQLNSAFPLMSHSLLNLFLSWWPSQLFCFPTFQACQWSSCSSNLTCASGGKIALWFLLPSTHWQSSWWGNVVRE